MKLAKRHDLPNHRVIVAGPFRRRGLFRHGLAMPADSRDGYCLCVQRGGVLSELADEGAVEPIVDKHYRDRVIGICTEPHTAQLRFIAFAEEPGASTMGLCLVLNVSWRFDIRQFLLQRGASETAGDAVWTRQEVDSFLAPVGLDEPTVKRTVDTLLVMLCEQDVRIACRSKTVGELVDRSELSYKAWQRLLDRVLVPYGIHATLLGCHLDRASANEYLDLQRQIREMIVCRSQAQCEEAILDVTAKADLSPRDKQREVERTRREIEARRDAHLTRAGISVGMPNDDGTLPLSFVRRVMEAPLAAVVYLALLLPTPLVVFLIWQWYDLSRYVARGNDLVWLFGGCAAVVVWACRLPCILVLFLWPRAPYCGVAIWNPKSLLLAYGPARSQLNSGLKLGVMSAVRRWADSVLSLARVPRQRVGFYNFFMHESEPNQVTPATSTGALRTGEFSQEGVRRHSPSLRAIAVAVDVLVWAVALTAYCGIRSFWR